MVVKIAFFDFDDTLFPSSYLRTFSKNINVNFYDLKIDIKEDYAILDILITNLMTDLLKKDYNIAIISCAQTAHIIDCINIYSDEFKSIMNKITIYGRDNILVNETAQEWKYTKMIDFIKSLKTINDDTYEIMSFGDSENERQAYLNICKQFKCVPKNIKLSERPSIVQLCHQWKRIHACINIVIQSLDIVDLMLIYVQEKTPVINKNVTVC